MCVVETSVYNLWDSKFCTVTCPNKSRTLL